MQFKSLCVASVYLAICVGCINRAGHVERPTNPAPNAASNNVSTGVASYYGGKDGLANRKTASGERYNPNALTAAHRTFPFGSQVRVTNARNGKQVIVRINDRGPYENGRVIDLSSRAAKTIDLQKNGVDKVTLEPIDEKDRQAGKVD